MKHVSCSVMLNLREDEKTRTLCKPRIKRSNDAVEQKRGVVSETEVALDTETKSSVAVVKRYALTGGAPGYLTQGRSSRSKGPKARVRLLGRGHRAPSPLAKKSAWVALNSRAMSGAKSRKKLVWVYFWDSKIIFVRNTLFRCHSWA